MIPYRRLFLIVMLMLSIHSCSQNTFTPAEQQQIMIATPNLFPPSEAFTVDFESMKDKEYSFPLPVGRAEKKAGNRVDIYTTPGDAVKCMFDGVVRISKFIPDYGHVVVVRHPTGLETVYANNAQNLVKSGQKVKAGQTLAIVGMEGNKVYCRFYIMINGGVMNPEMIVNLHSHKLIRQTILVEKEKGGRINVSTFNSAVKEINETADDVVAFAHSNTFILDLSKIGDDNWCYPLPGGRVISAYMQGRKHTGTDIKTKPSDNVYAAFDGVVTMSQVFAAYGNCIIIKHPNGLETLYSHNVRNLVKKGDRVKAGQKIALTGRTGRATTEHLHFETRLNGRHFNSNIIFDHAAHRLRTDKVISFKKKGSGFGITSADAKK